MQPSEFMALDFDDALELAGRVAKARDAELDLLQELILAVIRSNGGRV